MEAMPMRISTWVQAVISLVALGFILWHVPTVALWSALGQVELAWLVPVFATTLVMLWVRYQKWHRLLAAAGLDVSPSDAARSLFCGYALSVITPGRLGEFGRCLFLPESSRSQALHLNILERALDAWAVVTFGVASLTLAMFRPVGIFALAVWLAVLPLILGLPGLMSAVAEHKFWRNRSARYLRAAAETVSKIRTASFVGWSLSSTALDSLIFFFILQAFRPTSFGVSLIAFPWIVIAGGMPISVGGIGPREGAAALVLARYAFSPAVAMDAAMFLFAFSALLPAIFGGGWILVTKFQEAKHRADGFENVLASNKTSELVIENSAEAKAAAIS